MLRHPRTLLLCLAILAPLGLSGRSESTPEKAPAPTWKDPRYPNIEVYIQKYKAPAGTGPVGSIFHPNFRGSNAKARLRVGDSTHEPEKQPYRASLEYVGQERQGDIYFFSYSVPLKTGERTVDQTVCYSGNDIEIYRDDEYVIGIRPNHRPQL